jgi:hypothetical protein
MLQGVALHDKAVAGRPSVKDGVVPFWPAVHPSSLSASECAFAEQSANITAFQRTFIRSGYEYH